MSLRTFEPYWHRSANQKVASIRCCWPVRSSKCFQRLQPSKINDRIAGQVMTALPISIQSAKSSSHPTPKAPTKQTCGDCIQLQASAWSKLISIQGNERSHKPPRSHQSVTVTVTISQRILRRKSRQNWQGRNRARWTSWGIWVKPGKCSTNQIGTLWSVSSSCLLSSKEYNRTLRKSHARGRIQSPIKRSQLTSTHNDSRATALKPPCPWLKRVPFLKRNRQTTAKPILANAGYSRPGTGPRRILPTMAATYCW